MSADLYQRPSREEIAARVNGTLPGARKPEPQPDPLASFARHLKARMRALGWDQEQLEQRSGLSQRIAARAINGTYVDLETAGKIAAIVGSHLAAMLGPYKCGTCNGTPPPGYACLECGAEKRPSADHSAARERLEQATAERTGRPA